MAAKKGSAFTRILQLVLDKPSVEKTKKDTQKGIQDATDPKVGAANLSKLDRALNATRGVVTRFADAFRAAGRVITTATAAVVGYALAVTRLAERGGEVLGVQRAFKNVVGDVDAALTKLRRTTGGLISDFDLMRGMNQAVALGAVQTVDQFAEMSRVALDLGRALGVDATFAMESLVTGVGRGSKLILDNLGIVVDGAVTVENVMEAARKRIAQLGGAVTTGADAVQRWKTAVVNAKDAVAVFVANSDALKIAFNEASNVLETLTLALQTGDKAEVINAAKMVGTLVGTAFAAAFFDSVAAVFRVAVPKGLEGRLGTLLLPIVGPLEGIARLSSRAAEEAWASASAQIDALDALKRALESERAARGGDVTAPVIRAGIQAGGEEAAGAARKDAEERIRLLLQAKELGRATVEEERQLQIIAEAISATLSQGNLALEERVRLASMLRDIVASTRIPEVGERDPKDALAAGRASIAEPGGPIVAGPVIPEFDPNEAPDRVRSAWAEAFQAIGTEASAMSELLAGLFAGSGESFAQMLAQLAPRKAKENLVRALEAAGAGLARLVLYGDAAGAAAGAKASGLHLAAAAGWKALGAGGGGRGGGGGGFGGGGFRPSAPPGRLADRMHAQQNITIIQYIDGIDPKNGAHQVKIGEANVQFQQRRGSRLTDGSVRR